MDLDIGEIDDGGDYDEFGQENREGTLEGEVAADDHLGGDLESGVETSLLTSDKVPRHLTSLDKKLLWFYASMQPEKVDLMDSFGSTFLIQADCLVLRLAASTKLGGALEDSPQFLRMIYFIEDLGRQVHELGGFFTFVFFDACEALFAEYDYSFRALRNLFLLHCKMSASVIDVKVFNHWWSEDYLEFLADKKPSFMLVEECSSVWTSMPSWPATGEPESPTTATPCGAGSESGEEEDTVDITQVILFSMVLASLHNSLGVAFFHDLTPRGRNLYGWALLPQSLFPDLHAECLEAVPQLCAARMTHSAEDQDEDYLSVSTLGAALCHRQSPVDTQSCQLSPPGLRSVIAARLLKAGLPDTDEDHQRNCILFTKFIVIKEHVLSCVPLPDRNQERCTICEDWLQDFAKFYLHTAAECIQQLSSSVKSDNDVTQLLRIVEPSEVADFFDFTFLQLLMAFAGVEALNLQSRSINADFFGVSDSIASGISAFWKEHMAKPLEEHVDPNLRDDLANFFPINCQPIIDCEENKEALQRLGDRLQTHTDEQAEPLPEILPLDNTLVRYVLRQKATNAPYPFTQCATELDWPFEKDDKSRIEDRMEVYIQLNEQGETRYLKRLVFLEKRKGLKQKLMTMKPAEAAQYRQKLVNRWRMKELQNLQRSAQSLSGSQGLHHPVVLRAIGHPWKDDEAATTGKKATDSDLPAKKSGGAREKPEPADKKMSAKKLAIIEKNKSQQVQKTLSRETDNSKTLNKRLDVLNKTVPPEEFNAMLLDVVAGTGRRMDTFKDFPGISSLLLLPESQCKFLLKVINVCLSHQLAFKPLTFAARGPSAVPEANRTISLTFRLVHDVYNSFPSLMDVEAITILQNTLIACGFMESSKLLYKHWCRLRHSLAEDAASQPSAAPSTQQKKGKADQKSGGKKAKAKADAAAKEKMTKQLQKELDSAFVSPESVEVSAFRVPPGIEGTYQMMFMGHDMDRTTGTEADPKGRVKFKPDAWQVELLDIVDRQDSALVIAPTAAGKTFICFYAMDVALRRDDQAVVVFVAPTKALVNQVRNEVYARFSSKSYKTGSTVLQGYAMTEICEDVMNSQVVIMTPSMLEGFLLSSAPKHREWIKRLRYVIIDEIHTIRSAASDQVEHLIQLIPCPFLALSATVGNPVSFLDWLVRAQLNNKTRGQKVHLVTHDERHSDLHLHVYSYDQDAVISLNSLTCLRYRQWVEHCVPSGFYLNTLEVLQLHEAMRRVLKDAKPPCTSEPSLVRTYTTRDGVDVQMDDVAFKVAQKAAFSPNTGYTIDVQQCEDSCRRVFSSLDEAQAKYFLSSLYDIGKTELKNISSKLSPDVALSKTRCVTKYEFRLYMCALKASFQRLVDTLIITHPVYDEIVNVLKGQLSCDDENEWTRMMLKDQTNLPAFLNTAKPPDAEILIANRQCQKTSFQDPTRLLNVIRRFNSRQLLPMIIFNFDTDLLDKLAKGLFDKFKKEQWNKYYGDEDATYRTKLLNKQRMDKYKAMLKQMQMTEKLKGMSREQRDEQGLDGDVDIVGDVPPPPGDISEEIDPEFSLADRTAVGIHGEWITNQIAQLEKNRGRIPDWQIDGIKRGIGVHHERLNTGYRVAVEILFRMGFLKVVFASGTLALGVNMPCHTTMFAGDSLELTPLMFRQMSGRAGRRGYDSKGHVVFWDVNSDKIERLVSAAMPILTGFFPVSLCLTLKSIALHERLSESNTGTSLLMIDGFSQTLAQPLFSVLHRNVKASDEDANRIFFLSSCQYRFMLEFLRRNHWIDAKGGCSIAAHAALHISQDEELGSLIILKLITSGVLTRILNETTEKYNGLSPVRIFEEQERAILPVLASLLSVAPLKNWSVLKYRYRMQRALERKQLHGTGGKVVLPFSDYSPMIPPLDPQVEQVIQEQNEMLLDLQLKCQFVYNRIYAQLKNAPSLTPTSWNEECSLPMCGLRFTGNSFSVESPLLEGLRKTKLVNSTRSPFAAIAGLKSLDVVSTIELCASVRKTSYLQPGMIPQITSNTTTIEKICLNKEDVFLRGDAEDLPMRNSYILEFFMHGQFRVLENNGIKGSDQYYLVRNFMNCLEAITYVLQKVKCEPVVAETIYRLKEKIDTMFRSAKA